MALDLRKIISLSAAVLAFWINVLFAGTYFVNQGHGSASDASADSENAPWLSIQHDVAQLQDGDTLYVVEATAAERVTISGRVENDQGTPLCALVLANGQHMFSCGGDGAYSLDVPLDDQGQITLQCFADGIAPFKQVLSPAQAANYTAILSAATSGKTLSVHAAVTTPDANRAVISGSVLADASPVCALVLANGQHMFSCGGDGAYSLDVPLDANGEITLFVFAAGFQPYRDIIPGGSRAQQLQACQTWMYQIQDLDEDGAVAALAATDYPLLVLEPGHNFSDFSYDTPAMISSLRRTPSRHRRLLLAYVDVGQAEDYRDYWEGDWVAPTATRRGTPDFLVTMDPDGWSGNYPVAYWDSRWKSIWLGETGIAAQLARMGFDGIYLDWVEAYDDDAVIAAAAAAGVDPATEMIAFVAELRAAGRTVIPDFLVIPQNAPYLIDSDPDGYAAAIDGLAVEDTWFHGAGDADWDDPDAGDLHERHDEDWSTANRLQQYRLYQDRGLPVFSVDYCISTVNAAQVYTEARSAGLRPLVTRVSLSRLTVTPPGQY
jgi:cysteinyl-tRNA synthetase